MLVKLSFEEYCNYYKTYKRFPNGAYCNPDKSLNEKQLKNKYEKYLDRINKKSNTILRSVEKKTKPKKKTEYMTKVLEAERRAFGLNPNAEEFFSKLTLEEINIIYENMWGEMGKLDPCHIVGRGRAPHLSYDTSNVIIAPRGFHYFIDKNLNPFSKDHENISEEKKNEIWIKLVGIERWNILQEKRKGELTI